MTTVANVEAVLARGRRLRARIRTMRGAGARWEFTFPSDLRSWGLMPVEQLEVDVGGLFVFDRRRSSWLCVRRRALSR